MNNIVEITSIKSFWINYCDKSSLHGLRYVVHKEVKLWERLVWAILLAVAGVTIFVHLYVSWKTYSYSSMEIVVDDPRYPLSKIDFPAITFCTTNKIVYSKAKQLILNKYDHDPELRKKYRNSLYVLDMLQYPYYNDLSLFVQNNSVVDLPLNNITDLMLKLMPTIDEIFNSCYWRGTGYNCSDIIRLQRTEEGFCYSFNSKTSERTANDNEINPPMIGQNDILIPLRNNAAGKMTGLEVLLKDINEYFPNNVQAKGYNIMIHTPEDFPDISSSYKVYSHLNQSSHISVSVSHIKADKSLHRIAEKDRNCFLYKRRSMKDKNLPATKSNAEDNCYSKCRLQTTYKMCNCTPYVFDVEENNRNCGIEHINCLGKMNVLQQSVEAPDEPGFPKWSVPVFMNCSCPHPCSFIGYTTEIRIFESDFTEYKDRPSAYAHIDIHYKERFAISYQRSTKYTTQDLLVTFGGMASLFLGCSLISVLEIIYVLCKFVVMLKHKYTKIEAVPKRPEVIRYRRHHSYRFGKPLYIPPGKKSSDICFDVKY